MQIKTLVIGIIIIFTLMVTFMAIKISIDTNTWYEKLRDEIYFNGIIENVNIDNFGNDGFPDIKINGEWYFLGIRAGKDFAVGDSVVKDSNSVLLKKYRKNKSGEWIETLIYLKK